MVYLRLYGVYQVSDDGKPESQFQVLVAEHQISGAISTEFNDILLSISNHIGKHALRIIADYFGERTLNNLNGVFENNAQKRLFRNFKNDLKRYNLCRVSLTIV